MSIIITINNEDRTYNSIPQAVMSIAHEGRRNVAEKLNCRVADVYWAECLRMAWEMVKKYFANTAPRELNTAEKLNVLGHHLNSSNYRMFSKWEYGFICDNLNRCEQYGENTRFSAKQNEVIDRLYAKVA